MRTVSGNHLWGERIALFLRYWLPVIVWMGLIFVLSSQSDLPRYPTRLIDLLTKKLGHLSEYAVLAILAQRALTRGGVRASSPLLAVALSVAYALSDEYHQLHIPGRNGNLWDVVLDALGAVSGLAFFVWWRVRRQG